MLTYSLKVKDCDEFIGSVLYETRDRRNVLEALDRYTREAKPKPQ